MKPPFSTFWYEGCVCMTAKSQITETVHLCMKMKVCPSSPDADATSSHHSAILQHHLIAPAPTRQLGKALIKNVQGVVWQQLPLWLPHRLYMLSNVDTLKGRLPSLLGILAKHCVKMLQSTVDQAISDYGTRVP